MSYAPELNKEYLRERYAEQRQDMLDYLGGKCVGCGATESLEIDHIDWRTKSFTVSRLYGLSRLPEVYAEMDKCQLLCTECHTEKTKQDLAEQRRENPNYAQVQHGSKTGWMKTKCRCGPCNESRRVWNDARKETRRKVSGEGRGEYGRPAEHGEILMYRRGCKCRPCKDANNAYAKTLRRKKD